MKRKLGSVIASVQVATTGPRDKPQYTYAWSQPKHILVDAQRLFSDNNSFAFNPLSLYPILQEWSS